MMQLFSQCCADKAVASDNTTPPDAYVKAPPVEINSEDEDDHLDNLNYQLSINELPAEILLLILESLDKVSLFYCYFVCKRWRSLVVNIAIRDKTNRIWCFLFEQYQMESLYQQNSNSTCLLPFQDLLGYALNWNDKFSLTLSMSVPVIKAVQMNVYRDNIIVVTSAGVKYFDKKTFEIKKNIGLVKCNDFIENDYMVARSIKHDNGEGFKLQLFGKRCFDDCEWESQILTRGVTEFSSTQEIHVRVWKIEENRCFAVQPNNILNSYDWKYTQTPIEWDIQFLCRYYGGKGKVIAMDLRLGQVYLQISSGALFCYKLGGDRVMAKVYSFSGFLHARFVKLVHRGSLVLSAPDDSKRRVYRIRISNLPTLYRLEIPKLTCVTEHGIVLFLGYSDGKIKIVKPLAFSREHMFKRSIHVSTYKDGPRAPVVSIVVYIDNGKQSIFVATTSCVYQLTPTFQDEKNIWNKENIISLSYFPRADLISI